MKTSVNPADRRWNALQEAFPDLTPKVIRYLGPSDGWRDGMAVTAVVRGVGHSSHVLINGWQYMYVGTVEDGPDAGNTLYKEC